MKQEQEYSLLFEVGLVRQMLEHTRASEEHSPTFGQLADGRYRHDGRDWDPERDSIDTLNAKSVDLTKIPAGLNLVGDHAVYLMSNGKPL